VKKRMKNLCVIAVIILLASGTAYPQKPQETKDVGRYVLLAGTVLLTVTGSKPRPQDSEQKVPVVLKIDTVTGKTWELSIGMHEGKVYERWTPIEED
jgi:hypothetical protein